MKLLFFLLFALRAFFAEAAAEPPKLQLFLLDLGLEKISLSWPYQLFVSAPLKGGIAQWMMRLQVPAHYAIKNSPQGPRLSASSVVLSLDPGPSTTKEVFLLSDKGEVLEKYFLLIEVLPPGLPTLTPSPPKPLASSGQTSVLPASATAAAQAVKVKMLWMQFYQEGGAVLNNIGPGMELAFGNEQLRSRVGLNLALMTSQKPFFELAKKKYYGLYGEVWSPQLGFSQDFTGAVALWMERLPVPSGEDLSLAYPLVQVRGNLSRGWSGSVGLSPLANHDPFWTMQLNLRKEMVGYFMSFDFKWVRLTEDGTRVDLKTGMVGLGLAL